MKCLALALLLVACFAVVHAQDFNTNLDKYHHYRNRLVTEFMVVGDGQGMSMPAERRDTAAHFLKWSDNTIWLGWYAGMLALEYHLLTHPRYYLYNDGDTTATQRTLDELYYAMRGVIRLDEIAESAFPAPCDSLGQIRNGFFLRDDVDSGFYHHFAGMQRVESDFSAASVYQNEMSQDQVYHLLLGLALVKKFIPAHVVVNGMHIRQEAIDEALFILEWMHRDGWIIKNPACQSKDVDRGPDATLLSHGVNEMVKYFSDGAVDYASDVTAFYTFSWSTLVSPSNLAYDNENNLHMVMAIAAIGQGWEDTTLQVLMELAISNRWYAYPMICAALHDDTLAIDYHTMLDTMNVWTDSMLNEAPPEGPYTIYPDTNTHGYAVNNRFIRGRASHYVGHFFTAGSQFNGLDYMLLHNLYYLLSPSKWELLPPVGVADVVENDFELYNNFTSGNVIVKMKNRQPENIEIVDVWGRVMIRIQDVNSGELVISTSELSLGIYFIRVNTLLKKFVKI